MKNETKVVEGPKEPKAKGKGKSERPGMTGSVREQIAPFYNVVSAGVTTEWTDKLSEATAAYKMATLPKRIWRIDSVSSFLVSAEG